MKQKCKHYFIDIPALSLFVFCLYFFEGEKKGGDNNFENNTYSSVSSVEMIFKMFEKIFVGIIKFM
jgi:hypothetical protein